MAGGGWWLLTPRGERRGRSLIEAALDGEAATTAWQRLPEDTRAAYALWVGTVWTAAARAERASLTGRWAAAGELTGRLESRSLAELGDALPPI